MIKDRAPDFDLADLKGGSRSLQSLLADGPVLLAFFKVSCPTCQLTLPYLERLHQGKAPIVAISQDDSSATREFNRRYGLTLPTLLDSSAAGYPVSNAYRITNVPSLFLVEADGRISMAEAGFGKASLEALGQRFGVTVFKPSDRVPVFQPG